MALVQATVSIDINTALGDQTYVNDQYCFNFFGNIVADCNPSQTVSTIDLRYFPLGYMESVFEADTVDEASVTISANLRIGDQTYLESDDYIEAGYFVDSIVANEFQNVDATLSSNGYVGSLYVELGYFDTPDDYIEIAVPTNIFEAADASLTSSVQVSTDADLIAGAIIDVNIESDIQVATTFNLIDAEISVSISATTSIDVNADFGGEISANISGQVSLTASADFTASVSTAIGSTVTVFIDAVLIDAVDLEIVSEIDVIATRIAFNPRYTLIIPKETRVNTITQETRTVKIPKQTRELEFLV